MLKLDRTPSVVPHCNTGPFAVFTQLTANQAINVTIRNTNTFSVYNLQLQVPEKRIKALRLDKRMTFVDENEADCIEDVYCECQLNQQMWAIINVPKTLSLIWPSS